MPSRPGGLWRHRNFLTMWSGQAFALVGHEFSVLALPLVAILTLDAGPSAVALMVASANVPSVLFALLAGVVVDRLRRRRVIILTNVFRALLLSTIPTFALAGALTMAQMYVVAFCVGVLDVGFMTAYRSYVPTVVPKEHLPHAYALVGASDSVTRTAAPSVAGGVVQLFTAPAAIAVTAFSYLTAGLLTWTIRQPASPAAKHEHEPVWSSFRQGLAFACRHPLVRAFALSESSYFFFWSMLQSVLLVFLSRNLNLSPGVIGGIFTFGTLGGLIAAVFARRIGGRLRPGPTIILGSTLRSAGTLLLPLAAFLGPLALPFLIGTRLSNAFGWTLWSVHHETALQLLLPDELRARVNSSVLFLEGGALTLGPAVAAAVVAATSTVTTMIVGGLGTMIAVGWLLLARVWTLREHPQ